MTTFLVIGNILILIGWFFLIKGAINKKKGDFLYAANTIVIFATGLLCNTIFLSFNLIPFLKNITLMPLHKFALLTLIGGIVLIVLKKINKETGYGLYTLSSIICFSVTLLCLALNIFFAI